jgi:hypothetical protein
MEDQRFVLLNVENIEICMVLRYEGEEGLKSQKIKEKLRVSVLLINSRD